jgi:protein-tyrosine phosphatase
MPGIPWVIDLNPGRIAVMPRPRGGKLLEVDLKRLRSDGVGVLVSLLTDPELAELELQAEPSICEQLGITFLAFPIQDGSVPASDSRFAAFARRLADIVAGGSSVVIHCRMGVGRSALVAACVMGLLGQTPDQAFERISEARGFPVPDNQEQCDWVANFIRTCGG